MAMCLVEMLKEELKNKVLEDWIPFTEAEVDAKECFASHFMSDFRAGKGGGFCENVLPGLEGEISHAEDAESAEGEDGGCANALRSPRSPREIQLSPAARAVLDAGRELWRYYHAQPGANPNASYYDIRRHVKCKIENGERKMWESVLGRARIPVALKSAMKTLAKQFEPKVYAYGFLKK